MRVSHRLLRGRSSYHFDKELLVWRSNVHTIDCIALLVALIVLSQKLL